MRNPIRRKNFRARFWPAFLAGAIAVAFSAPSPASVAAGLPLVLLGTAVRTWGAGHLVKNDLMVCSGPYAHVRHPFYLGTLSIGLGFATMLGGWSALASLAILLPWFFGAYFPRKERVESERLSALHGADYDRYHAAVPALWPSLHAYRAAARAESDTESRIKSKAAWSVERYHDNNEVGTLLACALGLAALAAWVSING